MGDNVGQLNFGAIISEDDCVKLQENPNLFNKKEGHFFYKEVDPKSLIRVFSPYETYDYLVVIRASNKISFNCSEQIDLDFSKAPKWTEQIESFLNQYEIKPISKIGWILTGNYN